MDRALYKYNIYVNGINVPSKPAKVVFDVEFKKLLDYLTKLPMTDRRMELSKSEKVIYLEKCTSVKNADSSTFFYLTFVSLKYNQAREVVNKDTLISKGRLKEIEDGDKEYNHVAIIAQGNNVKATFEYNFFGLQSLGTIVSYFNEMNNNYFKTLGIDKYYYLEAHNEVNRDFIEELNKITQINLATFYIESNRLGNTDFGDLAGRKEVRSEIEVTFKRTRKNQIPKDIIRQYYNEMNTKGITRFYISGKNESNGIKLDTEEMKSKTSVSIRGNEYGEVDSNQIFEELRNFLMEE